MPLVKAVVAGAIAAIAIPFLTRGAEGEMSDLLRRALQSLAVG